MDEWVRANLIGCAGRDGFAIGHDHDPVGHLEGNVHVVFDEQQGRFGRERFEQLERFITEMRKAAPDIAAT